VHEIDKREMPAYAITLASGEGQPRCTFVGNRREPGTAILAEEAWVFRELGLHPVEEAASCVPHRLLYVGSVFDSTHRRCMPDQRCPWPLRRLLNVGDMRLELG
jgi:hypothetical protein